MTSASNDASDVWLISSLLMSDPRASRWRWGRSAECKSASAGTIILTYRASPPALPTPPSVPMATIARVRPCDRAPRAREAMRPKRAGTRSPLLRRLGAPGIVAWRDAVRARAVRRSSRRPRAGVRCRSAAGCRASRRRRTLAASLGAAAPRPMARSASTPRSTRLLATQLLARERWGGDWTRRDPARLRARAPRGRGDGARARTRCVVGGSPSRATAWWQAARDALDGGSRRAGRPREAARAGSPSSGRANVPRRASTDRLFDAASRRRGSRSQAGGRDRPRARPLLARTAVLRRWSDRYRRALDQPFAAIARELAAEPPAFALCDGFEDEACGRGRAGARPCSVAARRPVALDRAGPRPRAPRRARCSSARGVRDAPTRPAGSCRRRAPARRVMSLLQAARHDRERRRAGSTGSSPAADRRSPEAGPLAALEAICRRRRISRRDAVASRLPLHGWRGASARRRDCHARRDSRDGRDAHLAGVARCACATALERCGRARAAARRRRRPPGARRAGHRPAARVGASRIARPTASSRLTLAEFTRWADDVLERVAYRRRSRGCG